MNVLSVLMGIPAFGAMSAWGAAAPRSPSGPVPTAPISRALPTPHGVLNFRVLRSARRRTLGLRVDAMGLSVRAPLDMPLAQIDAAVVQHAAWAQRKLAEWRARVDRSTTDPGSPLGHGACLRYLGQPLLLRLDACAPLPVRWLDVPKDWSTPASAEGRPTPSLVLRLPREAPEAKVRAALQRAWTAQAYAVLSQRLAYWSGVMDLRPSGVALSRARTTWGSARHDGLIRLNQALLQLAPNLIDYVLVHELAHLREMNHSPRFWCLVNSVLPDAPLRRKQLRALGMARPF
ncbi:MAG: SprT family zinc-dependent metalloprotease [Rhodoferax sp.]